MKENICTKLRFPSNWKKLGVTSLMVFLCISLFASEPIDFDKAFKESVKIEQQIKRTSFPGKVYNIKDFGATTDTPDQPCHEQINLAITTCNQEGGGTVVIPKGTFYTGPITMKSNVNLHLEEGATLKFSTDQKLYFPGVITRWEGLDCYNARPLIYAYGESNIAITGKGTIDGQGSNEAWWPMCGAAHYGWKEGMHSQKLGSRERLMGYAELKRPIYERVMTPEDALRPQLINFYLCNTILIEDVTLLNSPFWVIHPLLCESLIVRGVKIYNRGPNGDGCDPESCKNVLIENCRFDTGDDCRGGIVENVFVRNIKVGQCHEAVLKINLLYESKENCNRAFPPIVRNVHLKNITCENSQYGIYAVGLPNKDCIYNISVEDSQFNNVKKGGNRIENVTDITMKNLQINGKTVK